MGEKKTHRIEIRVSESEKKELEKQAQNLGLTLSDFARRKIHSGNVIILSEEEKRNITGIGRNFNQLVKFCNATNKIPLGIVEELNRIIAQLKKHYY
ncbi:MAG: hypothetical protein Q4G27_00385 [Flavobacteriaceae bacterium]|nr:hypothetical protein [Flavobacteriaceae bacterium]